MIPVTYPSSFNASNESQMVVFALSSVAGLQRWTDYIPVKYQSTGIANSHDNNGYIWLDFLSSTTGKQAWVDYIPIYVDNTASDAWQVSANGYIPYNSLNDIISGFAVLPSSGSPTYTVTRTVLDSAGTSYSVPATVLDSAGTSYTPI